MKFTNYAKICFHSAIKSIYIFDDAVCACECGCDLCVGAANIFNLLTSHLSKMLESTEAIHKLTETDKGSFCVMETPCKKLFQFTDLAFLQQRNVFFGQKVLLTGTKCEVKCWCYAKNNFNLWLVWWVYNFHYTFQSERYANCGEQYLQYSPLRMSPFKN